MEIRKKGNHKKAVIFSAVFVSAAAACVGSWIFFAQSGEEETVYKETTAEYGPLTVGITQEGTVAVGTVEQSFDLDISEYSGGMSDFRFGGPMGGMQMTGGTRQLEVEEVYVSVGQQVKKGDSLFKLTADSVEEIREELVSDQEDARLAYDSLLVQQQKASQEASQTYEQNQIYGNAAQLEYDESLYELLEAAEDALDALEDAQEDLSDYQSDLAEVQEDYNEAARYLQEAQAATESESDTYWYLKNEESREAAKRTVEEEEEKIEDLENKIRDKEWEIVSLKAAWDDCDLPKYLSKKRD